MTTQVVFDAATAVSFQTPGSSTTFTHTPVGTPTAVAVIVDYGFVAQSVTSITYGGVAMTVEVTKNNSIGMGGNDCNVAIYGLANPSSGAQSVVVTLSGSCWFGATAVTVTGSDTTTCFDGHASSNFTGVSAFNVDCPSSANDLILDAVQAATTTATVNAGQTKRISDSASVVTISGSTRDGSATQTNMSWSLGATPEITYVAAAFKAGGASAGVVKTVDGVAIASVKTVDGVAIASVKTINGVANV